MIKHLLPLALVWLAACATPTLVAEVTPTPTTPPPSHTFTPTPTRTATATRTASPTYTPAPPTATPWPTLNFTPATPLADASRYRLRAWNEQWANEVIETARQFATAKSASYFGHPDIRLANGVALASSEALHRFDENPYLENWRWIQAYHLAVHNSPVAGDAYGTLMTSALNSQAVNPQELQAWFTRHQADWSLTLQELHTPAAMEAGYLVTIKPNIDELGGACLIISKKAGEYQTFVAESGFNYQQVELGLRLWISCSATDLTDDGQDEVIAGSYFGGHLGESLDYVYSLTTEVPSQLKFGPNGPTVVGGWLRETFIEEEAGQARLFLTRFNFPCAAEINDQAEFTWNGSWFETQPYQSKISGPFEIDQLDSCLSVVNQLITENDPASNVSLLKTTLNSWPRNAPHDELNYKLALALALTGNLAEARATLSDIIATPSVITSTWIAPAQKFLDTYQTPEDLYSACALEQLCSTRFAIEQLVRTQARADFPSTIEILRERGVPIVASGLFDFEGDEEPEHWFTVRHSRQKQTELWLIARTPNGLKALLVSEISGTPTFSRLNATSTIQIKTGSTESFFTLVRAPNTGEPFVAIIEPTSELPATAVTLYQAAADDLWAGEDPTTVRAALLKARAAPGFDCESLDCPEFEYLLGLSAELAGDEQVAVETYFNLWRTYPESLFALMASAKLEPAP